MLMTTMITTMTTITMMMMMMLQKNTCVLQDQEANNNIAWNFNMYEYFSDKQVLKNVYLANPYLADLLLSPQVLLQYCNGISPMTKKSFEIKIKKSHARHHDKHKNPVAKRHQHSVDTQSNRIFVYVPSRKQSDQHRTLSRSRKIFVLVHSSRDQIYFATNCGAVKIYSTKKGYN